MKEPEYNDNGCVSGGFIFDQMDRYAHDVIKRYIGNDVFVFTKKAEVDFTKQICDWTRVAVNSYEIDIIDDNEFRVSVWIEDDLENVYAGGEFIFVVKDHAYCKEVEK